jgi:4-hydroxy-4-methyl-2-oxoglutarate aldolase
LGDVNMPIVCAGQIVHPGDVIVADDDGIVVVPRLQADEIAKKSAVREAREDQIRARYDAGELGIDINNMRPRLAEKGLVYKDME